MRSAIFLSILATITMTPVALCEFPEPDKLPAQPGLPDPLVMMDGTKVTTKGQWFDKRRPELKALFQHYMYGEVPSFPVQVNAGTAHEDTKAFGGKATLREVMLNVDSCLPSIYLLYVVPNGVKGPVPVFVGPNFCGNHCLVNDPKIHIPDSWMYDKYPGVKNNKASEEGRGKQIDVWAIEQTIDRGYAVATFYNGDVDPDRADKRGIMWSLFAMKKAKPATISAWAWGIHRCVDFLVTQKEIDPKRIAVVGHSRLGKTALLAAAFDDRIALAIPHQAGCGGTAPSRGKVGEQVKQINNGFPHWFNDNFKKFNAAPEKLPFDQNCLVALVAPRPVLFSNAVKDTWANPNGQFDVLKAADPVYRLLGAGGLEAKQMPETGKLIDSTLGYYIRPGEHSMTREDWKVFLDFADKNLKGAKN